MTLLLRTLTLKSKPNFGFVEYKYLTIDELINMRKYKELIQWYYNLSMINYTEDILNILKISPEMYREAMNRFYSDYTDVQKMQAYNNAALIVEQRNKKSYIQDCRIYSKSKMKGKNNGR
jgi:hypothetical protein